MGRCNARCRPSYRCPGSHCDLVECDYDRNARDASRFGPIVIDFHSGSGNVAGYRIELNSRDGLRKSIPPDSIVGLVPEARVTTRQPGWDAEFMEVAAS